MTGERDASLYDTEDHGRRQGFRVHGVVKEMETGCGIPELIVEVLDKDLVVDDRLGSTITAEDGSFELWYEKEDFQDLFFDQKPDLYLRVSTPTGEIIHTTEDKVRYGAETTEAFVILIAQEDLGSLKTVEIKSIQVSPQLAKADDKIDVTVEGNPGGQPRFSIAGVFSALDVPLAENPDRPGVYTGTYTAEVGDNVEDAPVTIVMTARDGKIICRQAEQRVTIDTLPPRISEANVSREVVRNGQTFVLNVVTEAGCTLAVDLADLDSTKDMLYLEAKTDKQNTYRKRIRISPKNENPNGIKPLRIIATDPAGNKSEPAVVRIDLRNSELHNIRAINGDVGDRLNKEGVVTLADLRRIDVVTLAEATGLPEAELAGYRAAAKFQAIGLDPGVVDALVQLSDIRSPAELALTPCEKVVEIVEAGVEQGIVSRDLAATTDLADRIIAAGVGTTAQVIDAHRYEAKRAEATCQTECSDEASAFGCHAYLLALIKISGLTNWDDLEQKFKWDFRSVTNAPVRRIDISIQVLERALKEDLGNPPRWPLHWLDYDRPLHRALIGILIEATGESEATLQRQYPQAFDQHQPLVNRNIVLEAILRSGSAPFGSHVEEQVDQAIANLAVPRLEALRRQSGLTLTELRNKYFISFAPVDCGPTSTCRQAVLSLQEYLAVQPIAYPTYDEWRLEQVRQFYPENVYTHEFKTSLIRGDRELLKQHLEQARAILEEVRVSAGGNRPDQEDLLRSFRWRNPYYTNIQLGLDLIQACYEVDDLMVRGHQAFFNEEYQQARRHYLEAAEKIRLTSIMICKPIKHILLPLWAPQKGDSYFNQSWYEVQRAVVNYFLAVLSSYAPENTPGVDLARGQASLAAVDAEGKFSKLYEPEIEPNQDYSDQWKTRLEEYGWGVQKSSWACVYIVNPDRYMLRGNTSASKQDRLGTLYYSNTQFTDAKIEIELDEHFDGGIIFRHSDDASASDPYRSGIVGIGTTKRDQIVGTTATALTDIKVAHKRPFAHPGGGNKFRITAEIRKDHVRATFYHFDTAHNWSPIGELQPIYLPELRKSGFIGFYCPIYEPTEEFPNNPGNVSYSRINVWDLSPATGAISDLAFFLPPEARVIQRNRVRNLLGSYVDRQGRRLNTLSTEISIDYYDNDWILEHHVVDKEPNEPLDASCGLWYGQGDDRLNRNKARQLLDGLPMLFCHQYFFLLPICLGDVANALGQFEEACQWYRLVYDESQPVNQRGVYLFLNDRIEGEMLRLRHAQNYVEWADYLFNENTQESLNEARMRYSRALQTMETERCCKNTQHQTIDMIEFGRSLQTVGGIGALDADHIYRRLAKAAGTPGKYKQVQTLIAEMQTIVTSTELSQPQQKVEKIAGQLAESEAKINPQPQLSALVKQEDSLLKRLSVIEVRHPEILDDIEMNIRLHHTPTIPGPTEPTGGPPNASFALPALVGPVSTGSANAEAASPPAPVPTPPPTTFIPYKAFKEPLVHDLYGKIGPFIGLSGNLAPEQPFWVEATLPVITGETLLQMLWLLRYGQCIPRNPVLETLTDRACLGIFHIDHCFNALGFPQHDLSVYRFEYLLAMAKNFAQMALAAEKDFIQFKDQFEKDMFELMNASQAVAIAQAGTRLTQLRVQEAHNQVATARLGVERVNAEIAVTKQRIAELGSGWSIFGIIFGTFAATVGAVAGGPAAAIIVGGATVGAMTGSYLAGLEESVENYYMQLRLLETVEYNAARQNLTNTLAAERSARQQARIAELEARFAAEKAEYLATQFFNPQLWSYLAREVKKNYRLYLTYGTIAAWLAQRALEFERGLVPQRRFAASGPDGSGSGLNTIRFDYFQPSQQGLLGADSLLRDIATLEQEKFLNDQRKLKITKVISLAQTQPLAFARFLQNGELHFGTSLLEFDLDYPGHYQRRIKDVRVNLFGLVGPEGIKATLTHLGPSEVVVKEWDPAAGEEVFTEKTLNHPMAEVALTNPQPGGIGRVVLTPEEPMLKPFEGKGVAGQWVFEMLKLSNQINFNTITDIQLVMEYTALADPDYRKEVLEQLPRTGTGIKPYSFCVDFSDACFHLKDGTRPLGMIETTDGVTGAHTLVFHTQASDFPPNQKNRRLTDVLVYFHAKDDKDNDADYATLNLYLSCDQRLSEENLTAADLIRMEPIPTNATLVPAERPPATYDSKSNYLGKWSAQSLNIQGTVGVADTWYLHIPPDLNPNFVKQENGQDVEVNGHKVLDFSGVQDVIFALHYKYDRELPSE